MSKTAQDRINNMIALYDYTLMPIETKLRHYMELQNSNSVPLRIAVQHLMDKTDVLQRILAEAITVISVQAEEIKVLNKHVDPHYSSL